MVRLSERKREYNTQEKVRWNLHSTHNARVTQSTCAHVCATMSQGRAIRDRFNSIPSALASSSSSSSSQTQLQLPIYAHTLNMNLSCGPQRSAANKLSRLDKSTAALRCVMLLCPTSDLHTHQRVYFCELKKKRVI